MNLFLQISSTNYQIGTISIPATSGTADTIPSVNLLSAVNGSSASMLPLPRDANGNPYLYVDSNTSIYAEPASTLTSAKVWNIVVVAGAY